MSDNKILVIDDDETLLEMVSAILEDSGFTPICIADSTQAHNAALEHAPKAVILDRMMPGIDGNEVLMQMQKDPHTQNIPVMMLTSKNDIAEVSKSLELGAKDYIVKPFDYDNLIVRLKNIMR